MPNVQYPLSGPVNFAPWFGQITVNLGQSSNDAAEKALVDKVASYGKQLGRIGDALIVLMKHLDDTSLSIEEAHAIRDLKCMLHEIANVKEQHGSKRVLRPSDPPPASKPSL